MYSKINLRILKELAVPAAFFAGGIVLWWGICLFSGIPEFLLPPPNVVVGALITNFSFLVVQLAITLGETALGFCISTFLAFIIAGLFVHSKMLKAGLYPFVIALKITPVLAITPFVVLWFGLGISSKIIVVILICVSGLVVNILKGLETVDEDRLNLFVSLSATRWQIFWKLRLPNSLPYFFAGLKITTMVALTGAFVAEFISGNSGIAYTIATATRSFESPLAFAGIVMTVAGGLGLFFIVSILEKKIVFWQTTEDV